MTFEPEPGKPLDLGEDVVIFTGLKEHGPASKIVYSESGREGTVYRVKKNGYLYALKTMYPAYQDPRVAMNAEKLRRYKDVPGLKVADRKVIAGRKYQTIVKNSPELNFAILMPWVNGHLWGNIMKDEVHPQKWYTNIAKIFLDTLCNLESQRLAHCDLSNSNFIISPSFKTIELVDIETMYTPEIPLPESGVSGGTPGYRTNWITQNGAWGANADRVAAGILCAEILAWNRTEVREIKSTNDSFFEDGEFGKKSQRYKLMVETLGKLNTSLPDLFKRIWFSKNFADCPKLSEWYDVVIGLEFDGGDGGGDEELIKCHNGHLISDLSLIYCPECGDPIYGVMTCPFCSNRTPLKSIYCAHCGKKQ